LLAFKDLAKNYNAILLLFAPNRKKAIDFFLRNAMRTGFLSKSFSSQFSDSPAITKDPA